MLSLEIEVELSLNEVTLQDGQVGFFETQAEPEEYLSVNKLAVTEVIENSRDSLSLF